MKELKTFAIVFLFSLGMMITLVNCNAPRDKNDMGTVERLPKGDYTIWNTGSRHIVKCVKEDGYVYLFCMSRCKKRIRENRKINEDSKITKKIN